jgi:hypothetical protein
MLSSSNNAQSPMHSAISPRINHERASPPIACHKHIPPDIKHHRVPAPEMSFTRSNLPLLLREIEALIEQGNE